MLLFVATFMYMRNFGIEMQTDDGWFMKVPRNYTWLGYVSWRYMNWSARLLPETALYFIFLIPVNLYYVINSLFTCLLVFSIARIFTVKSSVKQLILAACTVFFIDFSVLHSTLFWFTGSVNYLWPLALGTFLMIPYADYFYREKKEVKPLRYFIPTVLFSISNEQFLVCALGVVCVFHLCLIIKREKQNIWLCLNSLVLLAGFLLMYLSPGNKLRLDAETKTWMPDFESLSFLGHIRRGMSWFFDGWYHSFFAILLAITLLTILQLKHKKIKDVLLGYTFFAASFSLVLKESSFNFILIKDNFWIDKIKSGSVINIETAKAILPFIVWGIFLLVLFVAIIVTLDNKIFAALLLAASVLSSLIMWLSPTMYASGTRVFLCSGFFLGLVLYQLLNQQIKMYHDNKRKMICLSMVAIFPVLNLIISIYVNSGIK